MQTTFLFALFCTVSINATPINDMVKKKSSSSSLELLIDGLDPLLSKLKTLSSWDEKLSLLKELDGVKAFFHRSPIPSQFSTLSSKDWYLIYSLAAINQADIVFRGMDKSEESKTKLRDLLETLSQIEQFYTPIGGIIGYHHTFLKLLLEQDKPPRLSEDVSYRHPVGLDLRKKDANIHPSIRWGIEWLPHLAEIYPVGGAGDRLNLVDEATGLPLPAAMLQFSGKSLLEGLINDLIAREYIYFKLYNKQVKTPIVLMTSEEKDNHSYVMEIFYKHNWFGRGQDSFFFIKQPLVPVITQEGKWSLSDNLKLTLKPGGHGVIWKLAEDKEAFQWLASKGRQRALVRQINNPMAGIDSNLFALAGIGCQEKKVFGFASCDRLLGSPEGMNVVIENKKKEGFDYCLTNIEYTDFKQRGIEDRPASTGSPFSRYPSNTNILFIDIPAVQEALKKCPIPGKLINMKNQVPYIDSDGNRSTINGGRLESTMQNIADCFIDHFASRLEGKELGSHLKTFLIYNDRLKTISTTKKAFHSSESLEGTPEQAFFDLLKNSRQVLEQCQYQLPDEQEIKNYLENGPNLIFLYHPALGPLYSVIFQKITEGIIRENSEIQLNIAEVQLQNLEIDGSLIIDAQQPLGTIDEQGNIQFAHGNSCVLRNVIISNRGINREANNIFWRNQVVRHESLTIKLEEGAEFEAENVCFEGHHEFVVPTYQRMKITQCTDGKLQVDLKPIKAPSWYWKYSFDEQDHIVLEKVLHKTKTE